VAINSAAAHPAAG